MVTADPFVQRTVARFVPPDAWSRPSVLHLLLWGPLAGAALLLLANAWLGIDQQVADALYALEGHRWALRRTIATDLVVHRIGRDLSVLAWCAALSAWLRALASEHGRAWRRPLGYLVLSTLLAVTLVAWTKRWSNMDCPWDLLRYGGARPFVGLLQVRPIGLQRGVCFPAAHASAGYAWLALYFFLGVVQPRWRACGLLAGAGLGLLFGLSQQLRGAHFVSHDVWTFAICWATAAGLYRVFWPAADPDREPAIVAAERPA